MQDPAAAINIAVGPPTPELVPQQPGTGVLVARLCDPRARRFVFKKAHLSRDDFRRAPASLAPFSSLAAVARKSAGSCETFDADLTDLAHLMSSENVSMRCVRHQPRGPGPHGACGN